jgi:cellulose synthase/poly-beta-1,6-N-acetylglucosamine synthase-like glycosyltransferase
MKNKPLVSIIIAFYVDVPRFYEDLKKFSLQTYKNYEILVVTDNKKLKIQEKNVRVVWTKEKRTGPAEKRDFALKSAKGEICAFIDDDAYPEKNWLKNSVLLLFDKSVAAVGGPGITPPEDNYWEQMTGLVYSSFFCSGFAKYRFVRDKKRAVEDYPAYNLLVKTAVLKEIGGYGSHFYGGEDTLLCMKIINKGYNILYSPRVVVFHHRRALFAPYLSQIGNVGKHRGYFARTYPQTSRRFEYFVPSILAISLILFLSLSVVSITMLKITTVMLCSFISLGALSVLNQTSFFNSLVVGIAIILTHISYGLNFIIGLFTKALNH